jgi:hypothetical protein
MEMIYVRRRLAAGLILSVGVAVIGSLALGSASSSVELTQVTIMPNDTLWNLSQEYAPNMDPRDWIYEVYEYNTITGDLQPGETLTVPVYGNK